MTITSLNSIHHSSITRNILGPTTNYPFGTFSYGFAATGMGCASSDGTYKFLTPNANNQVYVNGVVKVTFETGSSMYDMCCNTTGSKILGVGVTSTAGKGLVKYSSDFGTTWTELDTNTFGTGILSIHLCAMSSDASKIALIVRVTSGDYILYISNDGGIGWMNTYYSLAYTLSSKYTLLMSADGQILMSGYYINRGGYPWIWGWVSIYPPMMSGLSTFSGHGMSPNGKNIIITGSYASMVAISNDYGKSWTLITNAGNGGWAGGGCSDDGKYISIITGGYGAVFSDNYGKTWSVRQVGGDPNRYLNIGTSYGYTINHNSTGSFATLRRPSGGGGFSTTDFITCIL